MLLGVQPRGVSPGPAVAGRVAGARSSALLPLPARAGSHVHCVSLFLTQMLGVKALVGLTEL